MAKCPKCSKSFSGPGNFCEGCAKGVHYGYSPLSNIGESFKTFNEFNELELKNATKVMGLLNADLELLKYDLFNKHGHIEPKLRVNGSYKSEYSKLENWYSDKFFDILEERLSDDGTKAYDPEYYRYLKNEFIDFKRNFYNLFSSEVIQNRYAGVSDTDLNISVKHD